MSNSLSLRKTVVYTLIAALLAWTLGSVAMTIALPASAAAADGTLIKMAGNPAVYYKNDNKRFVFPNQKTYMTWFADFSSVQTVSQSELESYPIGGNATYRPGTKLVKITTDPKVYAVEPGGTLRWITTEAIAKDLYGNDWNKKVEDVPDAFFVNYTVGSDVTSSSYPTGTLVKMANDATTYYIDGSSKRAIGSEAAFNANGFQWSHLIATSMDLSGYSTGSAISAQESDLSTVAGSGSGVVATGSGLSFALASGNPAGATVPMNANQVELLRFNASASSDGAVKISNLTVKRTGPGSQADFDNIYLYEGATRLTTGRSINSDSQSSSFNSLNVSIPAGQTKTLSVIGDIAASGTATSGNVHAFSIESASAVTSGATVSGSFPIKGNNFTIAGVSAGSVTIAKSGSVSNAKVGQKAVKVAEFKLTGGTSEDIMFKRVALFHGGSVSRSDLTNFELRQSSSVLATQPSINSSDLVVFDLGANAMKIEKGQSKVYEVYADISGTAKSGSGETIKFYLDEATDILADGLTYGYGVSVTRTGYDGDSCTASTGDCSYSTIDAGQVTISFNGPSARDVSRNGEDVVLMDFTIAAQVEAEFRQFIVRIDGGSGTADLVSGTSSNITDLKVVRKSDGVVVIGPNDLSGTGSDTVQSVTSTERFIQSAGTSNEYQITADLSSNITDSTKLRAAIKAFGASDIKNLDNNTFIAATDIVPSADILGNSMTVLTPSLALGLASSPVSNTYIKGASGAAVTSFNFTAGDADDIEITSLSITGYIDEDAGTTFATGTDNSVDVQDIFTSIWLKNEAGTQIGDKKSFTSGGVATFSNFSWTVPAGETETLTAYVDISSNAYQNSNNETLVVDIDLPADITARDSDGNSVTATGSSPNGNDSGANVVATVTNAGTITVAAGPIDSTVESQVVVAGTTLQPLANFRFSASNEELEITQVQFRVPTTTTDEIKKLYLFNGSTQLGNGVSVNASTGKAKFTYAAGSGLTVQKNDSKTLTVKGDLNTVSLGADSGATVSVDLMYDTSFEARSGPNSQGDTLLTSVGSADVSSQSMYLFKSVPTVSSVSLGSSTLLNGAENTLYTFKVTADAAEDISLKQIEFSITSSSTGTGDLGTFRFFRGSNDISSSVTVVDASNQSIESGNSLQEGATSAYVIFTTEELITAGSSTTFSLKATLSGFTAGADYVNTKIADDTDAFGTAYRYLATDASSLIGLASDSNEGGFDKSAQSFIWSDNSATPHYSNTSGTSRSADWFNGYLIDNLPTTGLTVQVPN